jgi:hypothetical protein
MPYFREKGYIVEGHLCPACRLPTGPRRTWPPGERCSECHNRGFIAWFVTCAACVNQVIITGKGRPSCSSCRGSGIRDYLSDVPPIIAETNPFV